MTATMSDGKTWTRSRASMNWWTAQNWCQALGLRPVTRVDIGCEVLDVYCTQSDTLNAIQEKWDTYGNHWLENRGNTYRAYLVIFRDGTIFLYDRSGAAYALCH